ncbi:hypothetical protein MTY_1209 [Moorella thermoacetica Y72]|uniref:Uncharacterized protein n=1 Tax=Moorella thermoacetica Y72 TaxID=1325331 RepID=A0A0S6UEQ8_NEOTH|nr:hypothetical protein MTY_1209 [Moorella thermoacetica Y72]
MAVKMFIKGKLQSYFPCATIYTYKMKGRGKRRVTL